MSREPLRPLDSLVTLVTERVATAKNPEMPYVGLEHIPSGGSALKQVGSSADSISTNGVFAHGDILFGKLRPRLRKSVRATQSGYCSTDVLVLRALPGTDPSFAGFLAQSDEVFRRAVQTEEGTKMPRCSWRDLRSTVVFAPESVGEQQRIAAILTSIDEAIEATEALIEKHQQIKAGLVHDLLTRGMPSSESEAMAQDWELVPASRVCSLITKGTTPPAEEMWQGGNGVRFLRVDNLTFTGELTFDASDFRIASKTHATTLARSRCQPDDVLMNIVGPPLGKVGLVVDEEVNINQAIAVFRPTPAIDPHYMLLWLTSEFAKRWILQRAKQTSGQVNVTLAMCQALPILLAPIDEQRGTVERVQSAEAVLKSLSRQAEKLRMQKQGLMQDLLTGKVRVPLLEAEPPVA